MLKNLVLSGGAIKGFTFIGAIRFLEENNALQYFETFVGSSAGSLMCFFISLGMSCHEIEIQCMDILKKYVNEPVDFNCVLHLNQTLGVDNGYIITKHLESICRDKLNDEHINFMNFMKKTGKNLIVCASNLNTRLPTYFSADTTPFINVIDAIRASITIPFIFTPKNINDNIYVDACLFNDFPIDVVKKFVAKDTLGIIIRCKTYNPSYPLNIVSYFWLMISSMLERINIKDTILDNITILEIDVKDEDSFNIDFNTMKLNIDIEKITKYIGKGYESAVRSTLASYLTQGYFVKNGHEDSCENSAPEKKDYTWVQSPPLIKTANFKLQERLREVFLS